MSRIEKALLRRYSGSKILRGSLILGAVGVAPLLLYIAVGPADGNPIGLGLLAGLAVPVSLAGACIGAIKMLIEWLTNRER